MSQPFQESIDKNKAEFRAAQAACAANPPTSQSAIDWPEPLGPEAYHGVLGEITRTLAPHSEADPVALLLQLAVAVGNLIGAGTFFRVGADLHFLKLFLTLVGVTAGGRKGTAWSLVIWIVSAIEQVWAANRIQSGMASGEGLIWAVRDPIEKQEPIRAKDKTVTGYQTIIEDQGVEDKRLLIVEPELARVLIAGQRDTNTLSTIVRQAWDTGNLRTLTRSTPAKSTGCHISIVSHITKSELLKTLNSTEAANGFANRFLFACVKRSKLLPHGGNLDQVNMAPLLRRLKEAVDFAKTAGELIRDEQSTELWEEVYPHLTRERMGLVGSVTSRAEAQTLRLSCLFAVLDKSNLIRVEHLAAALEVWRYCEDSARYIFGDSMGDATADALLEGLRAAPLGLTRQQISEGIFARHKRSEEINRALQVLVQRGLARSLQCETKGRPAERWFATAPSSRAA